MNNNPKKVTENDAQCNKRIGMSSNDQIDSLSAMGRDLQEALYSIVSRAFTESEQMMIPKCKDKERHKRDYNDIRKEWNY